MGREREEDEREGRNGTEDGTKGGKRAEIQGEEAEQALLQANPLRGS